MEVRTNESSSGKDAIGNIVQIPCDIEIPTQSTEDVPHNIAGFTATLNASQ